MSNLETDNARLKTGMALFRERLNMEPADFISFFEDVAPDFGKLIIEWEFGGLYPRPGLSDRDRELVIIASCAALGATGVDAVKMHIKAALERGILSKTEIVEALMQLTFGAGLPTAITAIGAARAAFAAFDQAFSTNA